MTDSTGPKHSGQWQPGQSGNPAGRPKGARHTALLALDAIGTAGAEEALKAVVAAARGGDMRAAEILLRRLWPERKGRPVEIDLPPIVAADDLVPAMSALMAAVGQGEVTAEEAQAIASLLDVQRRVIETQDLERRIAALEQNGGNHR